MKVGSRIVVPTVRHLLSIEMASKASRKCREAVQSWPALAHTLTKAKALVSRPESTAPPGQIEVHRPGADPGF
jgi:hypothetical protein